jgi:hypothetical protein
MDGVDLALQDLCNSERCIEACCYGATNGLDLGNGGGGGAGDD